ncbi:tetratricopeptide repeat protein [Alteromonas facilis]|nr:tetratricopeptide repeat protein [Alteromonas facilis]
MGVIQQELGKKAEAIGSFKKALEINSAFSKAADAMKRINQLSNG